MFQLLHSLRPKGQQEDTKKTVSHNDSNQHIKKAKIKKASNSKKIILKEDKSNDYHHCPKMDWQQVKSVLEKNGFEEIKLEDRLYIHLQKEKINLRIPKLRTLPTQYICHIITTSEIPKERFNCKIKK